LQARYPQSTNYRARFWRHQDNLALSATRYIVERINIAGRDEIIYNPEVASLIAFETDVVAPQLAPTAHQALGVLLRGSRAASAASAGLFSGPAAILARASIPRLQVFAICWPCL
jgi:hypothetical protein